MDRKAVAVIGGAVVDVLVTPAGPEVFQSGSYPAENIKMTFGGDALNEATVLSALGKKIYLHTVLGTDPQGDMIREHCRKHGIRLSGACSKEGTPTGINVVLVQENGERNFLTNRNGTLRKLGPEMCIRDRDGDTFFREDGRFSAGYFCRAE